MDINTVEKCIMKACHTMTCPHLFKHDVSEMECWVSGRSNLRSRKSAHLWVVLLIRQLSKTFHCKMGFYSSTLTGKMTYHKPLVLYNPTLPLTAASLSWINFCLTQWHRFVDDIGYCIEHNRVRYYEWANSIFFYKLLLIPIQYNIRFWFIKEVHWDEPF